MFITDQIYCYVLVNNKKAGSPLPWGSPYYALGEVQRIAYDAMVQGKTPNIKIVTVDNEVLMEMKVMKMKP